MDSPMQYLLALAPAVPMFAIALIGVLLALRQWRVNPVAARLVTIGLVILSAHALGTVLFNAELYRPFDRYQDASVYAQHVAQVKLTLFVMNIAGIAFITAAVFAQRKASGLIA